MAYDEVVRLEHYKEFAKRATTELLCCYTKAFINPFLVEISNANSQAEVGRVMAKVRRAI